MIKIELTEAEAHALTEHLFGVEHDQELCKSANNKIVAALDAVNV